MKATFEILSVTNNADGTSNATLALIAPVDFQGFPSGQIIMNRMSTAQVGPALVPGAQITVTFG